MDIEIRELSTPEELEEVINLQMVVGGLSERHVTSPITLTALSITHPRMGWVLGAYENGKMVGFSIALSTQEPGLVYGFMLAVDPNAQDGGVGRRLLLHGFDLNRQAGVERVCWTYEPMEAKNAHLYLNKLGGRCVHYHENYYYLDSGLHAGLPQDRVLVEVGLNEVGDKGARLMPLEQALAEHPVARADDLPDAHKVLVEIPHKMHELLPRDPEAAMAFRLDTRAVLNHYLNQRGYAAVQLISDVTDQGPRAFYLLNRIDAGE